MAGLAQESNLYKTLSSKYENKKGKDISESFYNECISETLNYKKREIQFVLFKLKMLNEPVDSGIGTINSLLNGLHKILDVVTGKNIKKMFIINILENALEEL